MTRLRGGNSRLSETSRLAGPFAESLSPWIVDKLSVVKQADKANLRPFLHKTSIFVGFASHTADTMSKIKELRGNNNSQTQLPCVTVTWKRQKDRERPYTDLCSLCGLAPNSWVSFIRKAPSSMTTVMNLLAMKLTFLINEEQRRVKGTNFAFQAFCLKFMITFEHQHFIFITKFSTKPPSCKYTAEKWLD